MYGLGLENSNVVVLRFPVKPILRDIKEEQTYLRFHYIVMLPINKKLFDVIRCKMIKKMKYMNYANHQKIPCHVATLHLHDTTTNTTKINDFQDDIFVKYI